MASTSPPSWRAKTWWRRSSTPRRVPTWVCGSIGTSVASRRAQQNVTGFQPIPAVDIRAGRCVQLVQGDFARETAYGDDPAEMARHWEAEGAQRLHVVDLDGARDGVRANASVIAKLLHAVNIPVQVGGGVRTLETAQQLLEEGADRVVVGTVAAEHSDALQTWVEAVRERLVVGVDARDGKV